LSPGPPRPISLSPSSTPKLQQMLFSGELSVVECLGKRRAEPSTALQEATARKMLPEGLKVATVDCDAPLPSGKSLLERLGVRASGDKPVTLLSASPTAHAPTALASSSVRSAEVLARALKSASAPSFVLANSTLDLHRYCLRRKMCLLLLSMGPPAAPTVLRAAKRHRSLPLVAVNRRTHSISFADMLPETNRPVLLALKPHVVSDMAATVVAYKGFLDKQEAVDVFVLQATGGELASKQLSSPPTITRQASGDEGGSQRMSPEEEPEKAAAASMREIVL